MALRVVQWATGGVGGGGHQGGARVDSVPAVCAAAPGIPTYLDLPPISGKAAPHLR